MNSIQVHKITDEYIKSKYIKPLGYELIEDFLWLLTLYPILTISTYYMNNQNNNVIYLNFLIILPILVITYLRVKVKRIIHSIIGIMVVAIISVLALGFIIKQYIDLAFLIIWAIYSIKKSIHTQRFQFNQNSLIKLEFFLIPQIIFSASMNLVNFEILTAIIGIVIMLLSIGYISKARNKRLSMDEDKYKNLSKRDSDIFIGGIIFLIGIIIFILYKLGIFEEAYKLTKKIGDFFSQLNKQNFNNPTENISNIPKNNNSMDFKNLIDNSNKQPSKIMMEITKIINLILEIMGCMILVCLSYIGINRLLIYIKKLKNKDKVTFVFNENKQDIFKKKVSRLKNIMTRDFFGSEREKIRKLYKNKILKYSGKKITINNSLTSSEIEKEILIKVSSDAKHITELYDRARYSNEEITKEDLEFLKKAK